MGFIVYVGIKFQVWLEEKASMNFDIMPIVLYGIIFPIVIGVLLRLPKLFIEIKQNKPWRFDWIRFVAIAIPTLFLIAMAILPYTAAAGIMKIPLIIMEGTPTIQVVAGIVLGYTLLDCLKE
ncbi:hypothetical protein [Oceanobacillus jordanicus]|uniref:Uncharacterized protein n=1 Tax=Oceanobacillus jordanicus TaxID=2867266 RepID=A0AAW5B5W1_9BACI|nr:hypothetical protein [Oceanobacillus jordanicus]MCG3419413.1 hypothetical protein [Oceanobacillus jordanicus]